MKLIVSAARILFIVGVIVELCAVSTLAALQLNCHAYCGFWCSESELEVPGKCGYGERCCKEVECPKFGGNCASALYHCNFNEADVKGAACPYERHCCKTPPPGAGFSFGSSYYKSVKGKLTYVPQITKTQTRKKGLPRLSSQRSYLPRFLLRKIPSQKNKGLPRGRG